VPRRQEEREEVMTEPALPDAILDGGPSDVAERDRLLHLTDPSATKVKLLIGNRYEHFELTTKVANHQARELKVFEWTGSTYVAE
jgi:Family of unknown function (DUF5988)